MNTTIENLFKRLSATYGSAWRNEIGSTPIADVNAVWEDALSVHLTMTHRIDWALENLPERCPNPIQFKNLCSAAPALEVPRLQDNSVITPGNREKMQAFLKLLKAQPKQDPKEWAKKLKARHDAGERTSLYQANCYQAALGMDGRKAWQ